MEGRKGGKKEKEEERMVVQYQRVVELDGKIGGRVEG